MRDQKLTSYIKRAMVIAENSPDAETKVGSILVSKLTGSVISEGYNGFVRGANDAALPKTRPAKYDYVIHAEQNLIYNAARNGVRTDSCFIVQTHSPCITCARAVFQAGIDTIYFKNYAPATDQIKVLGDLKLEYTTLGDYTKIIISPNTETL
jgi:dCMP deaminase